MHICKALAVVSVSYLSSVAMASDALVDTGASLNSAGIFGTNTFDSTFGGQTFFLSEAAQIDSFSLFVRYGYAYAQGYLAKWSDGGIAEVLYESDPVLAYSGNFSTEPTEVRFDFAPVQLAQEVEYVAFLKIRSELNGAIFSSSTYLSIATTPIRGHSVRGSTEGYLSGARRDAVPLSEVVWWSQEMDHALTVRGVSAVPEPSSVTLLFAGLAAVGTFVRRRSVKS